MLGQKIKELRVLKGLTQEDLADKTNLSVRTIQRIESGDVDPRTYTLNLLAQALGVELEEFTRDKIDQENSIEKQSNPEQWLALLHLSGIFVMLIPPVIIWIWKKEELKEYEDHFKVVMNFQISMLIYLIASLLLVFIIVGVVLLPLLGLFATAVTIYNSVKVINGEPYHYPLTMKILR